MRIIYLPARSVSYPLLLAGTVGIFGSNTAQLGALEIQMLMPGLPISGSSSVPARTPIRCSRASL